MALKFLDKKPVNLFTNCSSSEPVKVVKGSKTKVIPSAVNDYNKWMHGVDLADRYINVHLPRHKTVSWKRAMFQGLYYIMLSNAHLIYNSTTMKELSFGEFLTKLAQEFVPMLSQSGSPAKLTGRMHLITEASDGAKYCKHCYLQGKRSNSTYICDSCNVYLHAGCFVPYHQK